MIEFYADGIEIANDHVGGFVAFIIVLITLNTFLPNLVILKYIYTYIFYYFV